MDKQRFINEVNTRCEFNKYNHIFATDIEPELAVVEAELRPESMNPLGMAHGGFVYSMCDIAAGVVVSQYAGKFVTLSGNLYFMRPGKGKKLRCEARIIKRGAPSTSLTPAFLTTAAPSPPRARLRSI